MNWFKRLCTGILCGALLLSVMPMGVFADIRNPSQAQAGSYTSSTELAALLSGVFSGDIDIYSNGGCTSEVSMPLGLSMNKKTTYYVKDKTDSESIGGRQCYIYANAVYNKLFNEYVGHADGLKHSRVAVSGGGNSLSCSQLQNAGIRCGAYIRTTNKSSGAYNGSDGHSMIILSYNSSGITYLEGNGDGKGLIRIDTKSWSDFNKAHLSGRSRYISHIVQPTDSYYNANYVSYTVTYNANGGSGAPGAQVKKHGKTLTLSTAVPTRSGYTFQGWGTAANAKVSYKAGANFTANANTTLYAVWTKGCPGSHDYRYAVTKAPTAAAAGTLTGTCSRCDKTAAVALPRLNTTDYTYRVKTAATCTADGTGTYTWKTATYGSYSFQVTLSKTGHSYNGGVVTTEAGCTRQGVMTFTCTGCGHACTQSIDPVGHDYQDGLCTHCGEADPDYTVLTVNASCLAEHTENVTVCVYKKGFSQPLYSLEAENGSCEFRGLATGEYTVTISKKNHVPEAFCITVEAGVNTLDVLSYLVGDLNGDGKVNVSDISQLYIRIREEAPEAALRCDINGDGRVDVIDASRLYAHIRGTKPLH